jgi:hypothetical protein
MHVRGTPASGKTVLSRLLHDYSLAKTQNVILTALWNKEKSAAEFLAELCHNRGYTEVREDNVLNSNFIFIIDEAQQT